MSDYRHMRVIRCKVDMDKIGVSSLWDLENKFSEFSDLFDMNFSRAAIMVETGENPDILRIMKQLSILLYLARYILM